MVVHPEPPFVCTGYAPFQVLYTLIARIGKFETRVGSRVGSGWKILTLKLVSNSALVRNAEGDLELTLALIMIGCLCLYSGWSWPSLAYNGLGWIGRRCD